MKIHETIVPSEELINQINNNLNNYQQRPFLISREFLCNTPTIRLMYGVKSEIIVTYPSLTSLRAILFELHQVISKEKVLPASRIEILKENHKKITGFLPDVRTVKKSPNQIEIPSGLLNKLGKTICYQTTGKNFVDFDRFLMHELLNEIDNTIGCFSVDIIIRIPSCLLQNQFEFTILNSDHVLQPENRNRAIKIINFTELLLIYAPSTSTPLPGPPHRPGTSLLQHPTPNAPPSQLPSDIHTILQASRFIGNLLSKPSYYHLLFLQLSNNEVFTPSPSLFNNYIDFQGNKQGLIDDILRIYKQQQQQMQQNVDVGAIEKVFRDSILFLHVSSLLYHDRKDVLNNNNPQKILSNLPVLLCLIQSISLINLLCANNQSLSNECKELNHSLFSQICNFNAVFSTFQQLIDLINSTLLDDFHSFDRKCLSRIRSQQDFNQLLIETFPNSSANRMKANFIIQSQYNHLLQQASIFFPTLTNSFPPPPSISSISAFLPSPLQSPSHSPSSSLHSSPVHPFLPPSPPSKNLVNSNSMDTSTSSGVPLFTNLPSIIAPVPYYSNPVSSLNAQTNQIPPFLSYQVPISMPPNPFNQQQSPSTLPPFQPPSPVASSPTLHGSNHSNVYTDKSIPPMTATPPPLSTLITYDDSNKLYFYQYEDHLFGFQEGKYQMNDNQFVEFDMQTAKELFHPLGNYNSLNSDKLRKQLIHNQLVPISVEKGEDSQYKALSHQLFGDEKYFIIVKLLIINHILEFYPSKYCNLLDASRIQYYLYKLCKSDLSGDHVTLFSLSSILCCDLLIFSPLFTLPIRIKSTNNENTNKNQQQVKGSKVYTILYNNAKEYKSLVPFNPNKKSENIKNTPSGTTIITDSGNSFVNSTTNTTLLNNNHQNPTTQEGLRNSMDIDSNDTMNRIDISSLTTSISLAQQPAKFGFGNFTPNANPFAPSSLQQIEIQQVNNQATGSFTPKEERIIKIRKLEIKSNRIITIPTLTEITIKHIVLHNKLLPNLCGCLPEELIQKIIRELINTQKINEEILSKLLDESIENLDLSYSSLINNNILKLISEKCKNVRNLSVAYCLSITSEGIIYIANHCKSLESIDLSGCQLIKDEGVYELIKNCKSLVTINLTGCQQITTNAICSLSLLNNLENLSLKNCKQITDPVIESLTDKLIQLDLSDCDQITDSAVLSIAKKCNKIKMLKLTSPKITDFSIDQVANQCHSLELLELRGCDQISDQSISSITKNCTNLMSLALSSCKNNSFAFNFTNNFELNKNNHLNLLNLKFLDVSGCTNVVDSSLEFISKYCLHLQSLNLSGCENITDSGLIHLIHSHPDFHELNLTRCKNLSDSSIIILAKKWMKLKKLSLNSCIQISDQSIIELTKYSRKLSELDISFCDKVSDHSVKEFSIGFPSLQSLSLEELSQVTSTSLILLAGCSNLFTLNVAYCSGMNDSILKRIAEGCPLLQHINLSRCTNLSMDAIQYSIQLWPQLRSLQLRRYHFKANPISLFFHESLEQLDLSWSVEIDDDSISKIRCPRLQSIDIMWCTKITDNAITNLLHHCSQINFLNIRGCSKITPILAKFLSTTGRTVIR